MNRTGIRTCVVVLFSIFVIFSENENTSEKRIDKLIRIENSLSTQYRPANLNAIKKYLVDSCKEETNEQNIVFHKAYLFSLVGDEKVADSLYKRYVDSFSQNPTSDKQKISEAIGLNNTLRDCFWKSSENTIDLMRITPVIFEEPETTFCRIRTNKRILYKIKFLEKACEFENVFDSSVIDTVLQLLEKARFFTLKNPNPSKTYKLDFGDLSISSHMLNSVKILTNNNTYALNMTQLVDLNDEKFSRRLSTIRDVFKYVFSKENIWQKSIQNDSVVFPQIRANGVFYRKRDSTFYKYECPGGNPIWQTKLSLKRKKTFKLFGSDCHLFYIDKYIIGISAVNGKIIYRLDLDEINKNYYAADFSRFYLAARTNKQIVDIYQVRNGNKIESVNINELKNESLNMYGK